MSKRLKRLFFLAFCLPLGIFGAALPEDDPEGKKEPEKDKKTGDDGKAGEEEKPPKTTKETPPKTTKETPAAPPPPAPPPEDPALQTANRELLLVRAQLEAVRDGIEPNVAEDAVYLALREAEKAGELDEEGIKKALHTVLERHPEWKKQDKKPGFKVGADSTNQLPNEAPAQTTTQKRWNRFN